MNEREFVDLSTRLMKDLKEWIQNAESHTTFSTEDLRTLTEAAEIIDHVTSRIASDAAAKAERSS